MSKKAILYIVRHGKTMFNVLGRVQGWSDTPLTKKGEEGIHELGVGLAADNMQFKAAFSSDSGRTMLTMDILMEELGFPKIPYMKDKRIREWCFGSLDGGYEDVFKEVLSRTDAHKNVCNFQNLTYEKLANALMEVDTANWAEPWPVICKRIWTGFEDIAHAMIKQGGGNALVVSHSVTIRTLCSLIDSSSPHRERIDNGSVTIIEYDENSGFCLIKVGDISYRKKGREILKSRSPLNPF